MKNESKSTLGLHEFRKQLNSNILSLGHPGAPKIDISKENNILLGRTGAGRVRHPWDYLPLCPHCSSKLWMVHEDKTLWSTGEPKDDVKIYCGNCVRFVDNDIVVTDPLNEV